MGIPGTPVRGKDGRIKGNQFRLPYIYVHICKWVAAVMYINPGPAELFQLYFSSFGAGIANAISSFK